MVYSAFVSVKTVSLSGLQLSNDNFVFDIKIQRLRENDKVFSIFIEIFIGQSNGKGNAFWRKVKKSASCWKKKENIQMV